MKSPIKNNWCKYCGNIHTIESEVVCDIPVKTRNLYVYVGKPEFFALEIVINSFKENVNNFSSATFHPKLFQMKKSLDKARR